jgi:hypothetical protein
VFDTDVWQNTIGVGVIFSTGVTYSGVRNSQFKNVGNYSGAFASRHQPISFCCGTTANNASNFAVANDFNQYGLDGISLTNQSYFVAIGNRFNTSGTNNGSNTGVACVYANTNSYSTIAENNCYNTSGNGIDSNTNTGIAITGNLVELAGGSGISTAFDTNAAITGNTISDSQQFAQSVSNSGITVFGVCTNVTITGNTLSDDQGSPTQQYGIKQQTTSPATGACTNLNVSGNIGSGNVVGPHNLAPALTSCGTSPTVTGDSKSGVVTMGTGSPTGCVITFATAYAVAPACTVTWQATPLASQSYVVSASAITLTQTGTNSNKVNYTCASQSGG